MNNPRKQGYQSLSTPTTTPTYSSTSPAAAASETPINKGNLLSTNTTSKKLLPKPLKPKYTGPKRPSRFIPTGPPISMKPPKGGKKKQTKKKKGGKNKTRRKKTRGKKKRHRRTKKY